MTAVPFKRVTIRIEHPDGGHDEYLFLDGPKSGDLPLIVERKLGSPKAEYGEMIFTLPSWPASSYHRPAPPVLGPPIPPRHVGSLSCGKARRRETHEAHEWVLQAEDDSPEQVRASCPGWTIWEGNL